MQNQDTLNLLKECNSGSKMAVSSIDDILDQVKDQSLKALLEESKSSHEKLGNEIHALLNEYDEEDEEPGVMAKGMSWLKSNMKLTMDHSDQTIAALMTDGCDMGVKSLYQYLNQYVAANQKTIDLCTDLIEIEEKLRKELQSYL